VFSGLDKITGRIISFDVAINETVQFGALQVTPRVCYSRPPTETPNTDAFVEVDEVTLQGEIKRIFNGWMFAASPGLHAVEHPIYDVWVTDCKGAQQPVAENRPTRQSRRARNRSAQRRAQPGQQPRCRRNSACAGCNRASCRRCVVTSWRERPSLNGTAQNRIPKRVGFVADSQLPIAAAARLARTFLKSSPGPPPLTDVKAPSSGGK
jgi:hypothetical protein